MSALLNKMKTQTLQHKNPLSPVPHKFFVMDALLPENTIHFSFGRSPLSKEMRTLLAQRAILAGLVKSYSFVPPPMPKINYMTQQKRLHTISPSR